MYHTVYTKTVRYIKANSLGFWRVWQGGRRDRAQRKNNSPAVTNVTAEGDVCPLRGDDAVRRMSFIGST
jgi:hypothetical protein